jgi:hypothetical protein
MARSLSGPIILATRPRSFQRVVSFGREHCLGRLVFNIAGNKYRLFVWEQSGLTPEDLVPMIGRLNRVYEVLSRRRPLTLEMIRRLHQELGIPAESLIGPSVRHRVA